MKFFIWIKSHIETIFIALCIVCFLIPVIVHIFSPNVNSEITADGLIGYVIQTISALGTVLLAYVAIWQNKKMQEENDNAQNRMEKIALEANNLNIIAKIIEHEQYNLANLKKALDEFSEACDPQKILEEIGGNEIFDISMIINKLTMKIDNSFFALAREFRIKPELLKEDGNSLNKMVVIYFNFTKEFLEQYRTLSLPKLQEFVERFQEIREDFCRERENYLVEQETKLNKLIYGNLSLEEIKNLYRFYEKREEKTDGQNENGIG